jgi:hypothetical protein
MFLFPSNVGFDELGFTILLAKVLDLPIVGTFRVMT